ncbi:MAG: hypothetical protein MJZ34_08220 [Paludibacteraceae bacterium]|nr:hypothetical protein [Paludibacteraceae bacterium]
MDEVYRALVEGIKEVCMKPDCPKWVSEKLKKTVIKAKKIKEGNKEEQQETIINNREPVVGDKLRNKEKKDKSLYQIVELSYKIDGTQLYNVRIIEGNNCGEIIHNVPSSMFDILA